MSDKGDRYLRKAILEDALRDYKMAFISGPRQVGKTTLARSLLADRQNEYTWDDLRFKVLWNKDPIQSVETRGDGPILLDELHKDKKWKSKLKGVYDKVGQDMQILVTGSGRLDVYRKGGDSMLGRYLPYRLHPFSVAESSDPISVAKVFARTDINYKWSDLVMLGGFPEPLLKASEGKAQRWSRLRLDRLIHEDLRDFKTVSDLHSFRTLCELMPTKIGSPLSINSLQEDVGKAYATIWDWVEILDMMYFIFRVRPYSAKITRAIKAETKVYLYDILQIPSEDRGKRLENLAGLHLLKACHFWTDTAQGEFTLHYVRDKEKREVDFLVTKNKKPWMLIECKSGDVGISKSLLYFQKLLKPEHTFQLTSKGEYYKRYSALDVSVMNYERFFTGLV